MANREHPHCWPPFIDLINDPIDVRLLAVKQVPQLSLRPPSFRGNRAAVGIRCERIDSLLQSVVPASGSV